jgi:hypothetical protein
VEMPVAHEFKIREGLVLRFKVYGSREQALEAVGLRQYAMSRENTSPCLKRRLSSALGVGGG